MSRGVTDLENCEPRLQLANARKQVDHDAVEKINVFGEELWNVGIVEGMEQYQRFFILVDKTTILATSMTTLHRRVTAKLASSYITN